MNECRTLGVGVDIKGFRYDGSIPVQARIEEKLREVDSAVGRRFEHESGRSVFKVFEVADHNALGILQFPGGVCQCLAYGCDCRFYLADEAGINVADTKNVLRMPSNRAPTSPWRLN